MQYLVIFTPKEPVDPSAMSAEAAEAHKKELAQGRVLYRQGTLRRSWEIDTDRHGAVCLFEADSVQQAQALADTFPQVAAGAVETQMIPLKPDPAYFQVD